jgi:hypothetical protein
MDALKSLPGIGQAATEGAGPEEPAEE